jgi:hypothetical protein
MNFVSVHRFNGSSVGNSGKRWDCIIRSILEEANLDNKAKITIGTKRGIKIDSEEKWVNWEINAVQGDKKYYILCMREPLGECKYTLYEIVEDTKEDNRVKYTGTLSTSLFPQLKTVASGIVAVHLALDQRQKMVLTNKVQNGDQGSFQCQYGTITYTRQRVGTGMEYQYTLRLL